MARRPKNLRLGVFLNSRHVVYLSHETSGAVDVRYAPEGDLQVVGRTPGRPNRALTPRAMLGPRFKRAAVPRGPFLSQAALAAYSAATMADLRAGSPSRATNVSSSAQSAAGKWSPKRS